MREQLEQWLQTISKAVFKATDWLMEQTYRGLTQLQRFWTWYQQIDWPEIPLTPLQWILIFYGIFGLLFIWATPIFEAGEELKHFTYVQTVAEEGRLPELDAEMRLADQPGYLEHGAQPPLYYALSALLISPLDLSEAEAYQQRNPFARVERPLSYGNKNLVLHSLEDVESNATPLAVYLLRVVGLALGTVTVWVAYRIGQYAAPHRTVVGIIAAGLVAFNPMFLFVSASVNPFALAIPLSSLVVFLGLLTIRDGFTWQKSALIGVLFGLATLSGVSALLLAPALLFGGLWAAQRERDWLGYGVFVGALVVGFAVFAGWWIARNIGLYGLSDPLGLQTMAAIAPARKGAFGIGPFFSEFTHFRLTFWGMFGILNIQASAVFYAIVDFSVFLALFGVAFLVAQLVSIRDFSYARRELTLMLYLLGLVLAGLLGVLYWARLTDAPEGSLMFPFMGAVAPILAVGFVEIFWWTLFLLKPPDTSYVRAGDAVPEAVLRQGLRWPLRVLAFMVLLIPLFSVAPAYRAPRPVDTMPDNVESLAFDYGEIELIGYRRSDRRYSPGEDVRLTFYWRVQEQTEYDLHLDLTLISPYGDNLGSLQTYPGAGTLRTSTWEPGVIYPDTYEISLPNDMRVRYPFRVQVDWRDPVEDERVSVTNREGDNINFVVLDVGAVVSQSYVRNVDNFQTLNEVNVRDREFLAEDGTFRLQGYALDLERFIVYTEWEATQPPRVNYISYVQVLDENDNVVGEQTLLPELPTRYWDFNELYLMQHAVEFSENPLPPGTYRVVTGWFLADDPEGRIIAADEIPQEGEYMLILPDSDNEARFFTLFDFTISDAGAVRFPEPLLLTEEDELEAEITEPAAPLLAQTPFGGLRNPLEVTAEATEPVEGSDDAEANQEATPEAEATDEAGQAENG